MKVVARLPITASLQHCCDRLRHEPSHGGVRHCAWLMLCRSAASDTNRGFQRARPSPPLAGCSGMSDGVKIEGDLPRTSLHQIVIFRTHRDHVQPPPKRDLDLPCRMFATPATVANRMALDCPVLGCLPMDGQPTLGVLEGVDHVNRNENAAIGGARPPRTDQNSFFALYDWPRPVVDRPNPLPTCVAAEHTSGEFTSALWLQTHVIGLTRRKCDHAAVECNENDGVPDGDGSHRAI